MVAASPPVCRGREWSAAGLSRGRFTARGFSLLLLVLLTSACTQLGSQKSESVGSKDYIGGEVLVRFTDRVSDARRDAILAEVDGVILRRYTLVPNLYHVKVPMDLDRAIEILEGKREVLYAHANYRLYSTADTFPPDDGFDKQWALWVDTTPVVPFLLGFGSDTFRPLPGADIGAPGGWDFSTGSGSFIIAVIDTGLNNNMHEFDGNLWTKNEEVGWDFTTDPPGPVAADTTQHGTRVASIIGARANGDQPGSMVGVNWSCQLMPLRFIGATTEENTEGIIVSGSSALAILAIQYSVDEGAKVSNNSYGTEKIGDAWGLRDAIVYAGAAGQLFVTSAGNYGNDLEQTPFYPACFQPKPDNLVVVTATNHRLKLAVSPGASYSAAIVDIAAPGGPVYSHTSYDWGFHSGTSFAAAFVSGAAALYWDAHPTLTYQEVKDQMFSSASKKTVLHGYVEDKRFLNLRQLMAELPGPVDGERPWHNLLPEHLLNHDVVTATPPPP